MMLAKLLTPGLLLLRNEGYDVIILEYDVTNKTLSSDLIYIVDLVMWPKREVIITSILKEFNQKNYFLEGWSWFNFNNFGLALGMTFKFNTSVVKGLKVKLKMFWGLSPTFVEVIGEKLLKGSFLAPPIPNKVKISGTIFCPCRYFFVITLLILRLYSTGASDRSFYPIFNKRFDRFETLLAICRPKKFCQLGHFVGL